MSVTKILSSMIPVVDAFEQLGVAYYIGGSVASLAHGIYRATADVDIIADLRMEHVQPPVQLLQDTYYIDADMIRDAIKRRSEFNVLHLDTMFKVDIFIQKTRPFDHEVRRRLQQSKLNITGNSRLFFLESPEDVILNKLEWYKMVVKYLTANGMTYWVFSKYREHLLTWHISGNGLRHLTSLLSWTGLWRMQGCS